MRSFIHVGHFPLQIMKTSTIHVVCLQQMFVAISNGVIEDVVILPPNVFFLRRHCKQVFVYGCKLKSTVFSLPKRGFSSKKI